MWIGSGFDCFGAVRGPGGEGMINYPGGPPNKHVGKNWMTNIFPDITWKIQVL